MPLIKPLTEAEQDLQLKDSLVLRVAEATHHLAATLKNTNEQFWALPTDRLLAVLNADVASTLATFAANTAIGQAVNDSLDTLSLPQYPTRAPLTAGRSDIQLDNGGFVLVPEKPIIDPQPI